MSVAAAKTLVATGASSGLGFELVKQLLQQTQPYQFILGVRDTKRTESAFSAIDYDKSKHSLTILPVELSDLKTVQPFANQALEKLGSDKIDFLMLNAGMAKAADGPGPHGSKWCETYVVNHLSQHYLTHLLSDKLKESKSRIVVVSSGAVRGVKDPSLLDHDVKADSKTQRSIYAATKFIQLCGAHWWRRKLQDDCTVVAVSPGLIPQTGIDRHKLLGLGVNMADAKSIPEGAHSMLAALHRTDIPEDPEQIFLTSWGEWWPKVVYSQSLEVSLQNHWCPEKAQLEKDEGLVPETSEG